VRGDGGFSWGWGWGRTWEDVLACAVGEGVAAPGRVVDAEMGGDEGGQSQEGDEDLHFGLTWRLDGCGCALLGLTLGNVFAGLVGEDRIGLGS
jgi:hypothetical protein